LPANQELFEYVYTLPWLSVAMQNDVDGQDTAVRSTVTADPDDDVPPAGAVLAGAAFGLEDGSAVLITAEVSLRRATMSTLGRIQAKANAPKKAHQYPFASKPRSRAIREWRDAGNNPKTPKKNEIKMVGT
jgi:hypothetical protein